MHSTDADWKKLGSADPYYGVLAAEKYRKEYLAQNIKEFFASGEEFVADRLKKAKRHFDAVKFNDALDFGCGVGRLPLPLARTFESTLGIDVSDSMLLEAKANARRLGIFNATFALSDDDLSKAPGQYDFVNSYIVLQHIPVLRGMKIIEELMKRVRTGGILALHVCVDRNFRFARTLQYWARAHLPVVHRVGNVVRGRRWREPLMQMNEYPLAKILDRAQVRGFGPALVETEMHGTTLTAKLMCQKNL